MGLLASVLSRMAPGLAGNVKPADVRAAVRRVRRKLLGILQVELAKLIVGWVFKVRGSLRLERDGLAGLKPPFFVLGNHTSNLDPALVQYAVAPHPCYFLTSNYYFRLPVIGNILRLGGAIPKVQFYPDSRSTRRVAQAIANGEAVGIFPEGRRSIDGSACPIPESVARLIKKYKVPVVTVHTSGGYFVWPRWSPSWRRGGVETVARRLLAKDDIVNMEVDEIYQVICQALAYNEYDWNRQKKTKLYQEVAPNRLELILHQCPRCQSERAMRSLGSRLSCQACGNTAVVDEYGFLQPQDDTSIVFDDPVKWNAWQRGNMARQVAAENFRISATVRELRVADKYNGPFRSCGRGEIVLDRQGLRFCGQVDGQYRELFFPSTVLPAISTEFRDDFELCDRENAWWIFLAEAQQTIRLETAIALLYEQKLSAGAARTAS